MQASHVTDDRTADQAAERITLLEGAIDALQDGVLVLDANGWVAAANRRFARLFPTLLRSPVGMSYAALLRDLAASGALGAGRADQQVEARLAPVRERRIYSMRTRRNDRTTIEVFGEPVGEGGYVFTFADVTRQVALRSEVEAMILERTENLQRANDELSTLALRDPLLGILNRRGLFALGDAVRLEAMRQSRPTAVLMIDVDHFKSINDTHGHAAGDLALKSATAAIQNVLDESDLFARYGGEEFIVLLPGVCERGALERAETIRRAVEAAGVTLSGDRLRITVSIGVAALAGADTTIAQAIARADQATYRAKRASRNCVALATIDGAPVATARKESAASEGCEPPGLRTIPLPVGARV